MVICGVLEARFVIQDILAIQLFVILVIQIIQMELNTDRSSAYVASDKFGDPLCAIAKIGRPPRTGQRSAKAHKRLPHIGSITRVATVQRKDVGHVAV